MQFHFFKDNSFYNSYAVFQLQEINLSANVLKNRILPPVIYLTAYANTPTGPKAAPPLQEKTFVITPPAETTFLPCSKMK